MKKPGQLGPNQANGEGHLEGILDAALEIAEERRDTLRRLREALKAKNVAEVFRAAEELCGLSDDEKSNRVN
jgi:hypothetical protein